MEASLKKKLPYWDNLKGLLIFLVVFGHLLEGIPHISSSFIYKFIYLFHMPLFVFISGYLASYNPKTILKRLLCPYIIMQVVVGLVYSYPIQFLYPKKAMWYLLSLIAWRMLIPFLDLAPKKARPLVLLASIIIAYLVGFEEEIGFFLTISRTIVLFPYFITGYYLKQYFKEDKNKLSKFTEKSTSNKIIKAFITVLGLSATLLIYKISPMVKAKFIYGSQWYDNNEYAPYIRLGCYLFAAIIVLLILAWAPHFKTIFSKFGEISMDIFLLHPFFTNYFKHNDLLVGLPRLKAYIICLTAAFLFCIFILIIRTLINLIKAKIKSHKSK